MRANLTYGSRWQGMETRTLRPRRHPLTLPAEVALEPGFPRIGLINGRQLVDLLIEHWGNIPPEFRERLGLKPGLVRG